MEQNVVLEMRDISKNFTGVRALSHVDFTLRKGEIHALMGENGAGKSTLIKVLTGVHEFESGSIHMNGENKDIINHSPQEAQANGISTVYQEVNLCPNLTVAENLFIGREPRNKVGMINWKEMNARSAKLLESLNINVQAFQKLCRTCIHFFPVDHSNLVSRLTANKQVFRNSQVRTEVYFLVNRADSICLCLLRRMIDNVFIFTIHMNGTAFEFMYTGQNFDQC